MKILVIPDTQLKPGVPTQHISALGNWIEDQRPDRVIVGGDWWDFRSCSNYLTAREAENQRVLDDIEYGKSGMDLLWRSVNKRNRRVAGWKKKTYQPDKHFLMGNHELQLQRLWDRDPRLEGLITFDLLELDKHGFSVHDFNNPVELDGVTYSHYFPNPRSGRPVGGQIENRIKWIGSSFIQFHDQHFAYGEMTMAGGRRYSGMVCGSFYAHPEDYKGPTGNNHWRGVPILHDVRDGNYDLEKLSIDRLVSGWS